MPTISPDAIDRTSLALSVRQPYVTRILNGTKRFEYRSQPTNVRGRVLLYASATIDYDSMADEELPPPEPPTKVAQAFRALSTPRSTTEHDAQASTSPAPARRASSSPAPAEGWQSPWGRWGCCCSADLRFRSSHAEDASR